MNVAMFIVAPRCFGGTQRVSTAGHTRAFRSRAWQRRKPNAVLALANIRVICGRSPCLLRQPAPSGSGAQSAQRSRNLAPLAGRGQSIASPIIRSMRWVVRTPGSCRPSGRLSSPSGPAVCHRRAALRVIRHVVALPGVLFGAGSFEGPSNTALEPAAPVRSRAPRLSAGR